MNADTFYKELNRILHIFPLPPSQVFSSEGCEFCHNVYYSKNCYFCFDSANCSDSFYLFDSFMASNCGDCDYITECELLYESSDSYKCYHCNYIEDCSGLRDSNYCFNCVNGNNLFGCANLYNKSFCIFNRQLTEEEYKREIQKYKSLPPEKIFKLLEELKVKDPLYPTHANFENVNSDYGNYVYNNTNCYLSFDASFNEGSGYLYDSFHNKTSFDMTYGHRMEISYQITDSADCFNCNFCFDNKNCQDSWFLFSCLDVKDSIGCVGLSHKQYCILNRQLSKDEYEKIAPKLIQEIASKNIGWADLIGTR